MFYFLECKYLILDLVVPSYARKDCGNIDQKDRLSAVLESDDQRPIYESTLLGNYRLKLFSPCNTEGSQYHKFIASDLRLKG
jgi:hypothetical protein